MALIEPSETRNSAKEAAVRIVDLIAYFALVIGGIGAILVTPETVNETIGKYPIVLAVWIALMLAGGILGFIGRLTRIWVVETPGASFGFFGAAMYFVILALASVDGVTALVVASLVLMMMGFMARRWIELQILTSEPGDVTLLQRFVRMMKRRTTNTVSKHH